MKVNVGFVGLGQMGLPMVRSLSRNGDLTIHAFDTQEEPFETLQRDAGLSDNLRRAPRLSDLSACSHVVTMLPNSQITRDVIEGSSTSPGLATILSSGSTIIDMGSSNPVETLRLGEDLARRSVRLVDAPVSGSVAKAKSGSLAIMTGCDDDTLRELRFILDYMGSEIFATGSLGAAHSLKALNNYVYAAGLLAVSEAVCIAERLNLDTAILAKVLNSSSGRNVASETKLAQFILPREYKGGFSLRLQAKDLATAASLKELAGVEAPQLTLCQNVWAQASAHLADSADNTEIHRFLNNQHEEKALQCHS